MTDTRKIIIWGASGFALVVADAIRLNKSFEVAGYLDDISPQRKGEVFGGAVVLGGRDQLEKMSHEGIRDVVLGFGDCKARLGAAILLKEMGFRMATVVHPAAVVSETASLGLGVFVGAAAVIEPGVKIAEACIVNRGALIGHESMLDEGVNIAPGVNIGGRTSIGKGTFVGIGTTIINKIHVGSYAVIGAGAVVVKDIPGNVVAYGNPAKVIRNADE